MSVVLMAGDSIKRVRGVRRPTIAGGGSPACWWSGEIGGQHMKGQVGLEADGEKQNQMKAS